MSMFLKACFITWDLDSLRIRKLGFLSDEIDVELETFFLVFFSFDDRHPFRVVALW